MTGIAPATRSNFQSAVMRLEATQKIQTPEAQTPQLGSDGNSAGSIDGLNASQQTASPKKKDGAEDKFQEFVAGSFYKMMLKSLRSAQKPAKYLNGGQAEKVFQGQLDDQFADSMNKKSGHSISAPLYPAFLRAATSRSAVAETGAVAASGAQRGYSPAMLPAAEEVGNALNVTQ